MLVIYLILLVLLLILFVLLTAIVLTFKLNVLSLKEKNELGGTFTVKWLVFSHTFLIGEPGEKKYPSDESGIEEKEKEIVRSEIRQEKTGPERTESQREELKAEYMQIEERDSGEIEPEEKTVISESKQEIPESKQEIPESKQEIPESKQEIPESKQEIPESKQEIPESKQEIPESKQEFELKEKSRVKKKRGLFDRIKRKKRADEEAKAEEKKEMTLREKLHWGLEAYKSLRKPLFRLISDMLNTIKIKNLKADLTFGLPDPADTGMLCGFIHALLGTVYSRCRNCSFSVCPVFMESLLDFRGSAEIRIKIYSLVFPFLKFIFNGKTLSFTYSIVMEKLRGSSKINS
jgi:hypothetical protein